jgi:hypothetical protein
MFRRVIAVPLVLAAMVSAGVVADASSVATAAGAPTGTGAVQTVTGPAAGAQLASPTINCGTGLINTVCQVVLGPICKNHCGAPAAVGTTTGALSRTAQSALAGTTTATAGNAVPAASAPTMVCSPDLQLVCYVLGLTLCSSKHPCGVAATPTAMTATSAPTIDCDIQLVCLILALTVCRHGCAVESAPAVAATAVADRR